jgi:hypothetical protein
MFRAGSFLIISIVCMLTVHGQHIPTHLLNWKQVGVFPPSKGIPSIGLAGQSAGMNNDCMIVAGVTNFPDKFPWEGGKKMYFDDVFLFRKSSKGMLSLSAAHKLPMNLGYAATVSTAKGLLIAAINDPNPVLFFEHKVLYRSTELEEEVFDDYYMLDLTKAKLVKPGNEVSIITYGAGVHWASAYVKAENIDAEIIDLRCLLPWDKEAVEASVKKTGKAIILHEDTLTGGIGAEIAAHISEHCFKYLDAPVKRVGSLDTPVPFNMDLEQNFLPKERFKEALQALLGY